MLDDGMRVGDTSTPTAKARTVPVIRIIAKTTLLIAEAWMAFDLHVRPKNQNEVPRK
jgi:hypothetical protein